jgi:N-alpha-acetyltransferase 35, NatC auxiliary subunit
MKQAGTLGSALALRLEFRRRLMTALAAPFEPDLPPPLMHQLWTAVGELLSDIKLTNALAQPVLGAFSAKIQRRLASTVPPKPVVELSFEEAFEKLSVLCLDCREASRLTELEAAESPANLMVSALSI